MTDTICWDCKHATGGCRWADDHRPVKGWDAFRREESYIVRKCPEFIRSTYGFGQYRDAEEYIRVLEHAVHNRDRTIRRLRNEIDRLRELMEGE